MAIIAIPRPLRERLGDEGADALVEVLNQVAQDTHADTLTFVEEKFERRVSEEIAKVNQRLDAFENRFTLMEERFENRFTLLEQRFESHLAEEITKVNQRMTEEVTRLDQKISASHANLIKWMFIFWVGQIAVMSGILFAMLRLSIT